jgi:hypothetical protein
MNDTFETALLVLASVRAALINKTRHYSKDGRLLGSEKEIVEELLNQREMVFDTSESMNLTTEEEQLAIVRRQYQRS